MYVTSGEINMGQKLSSRLWSHSDTDEEPQNGKYLNLMRLKRVKLLYSCLTKCLLFEVMETEEVKKERALQREREEAARRNEDARREMIRQQFEKAKQRKLSVQRQEAWL